MAYRANATDFKPEFGVMYDPSIDDRIKELDEEGLRKLVLFKQALQPGVLCTPAMCQHFLGEDLAYYAAKTMVEHNQQIDAMEWGWVLPSWKAIMDDWSNIGTQVVLGGNRSSKSVCLSRICMWALMTIPEARIRVYHVNETKSITEQQQLVWEALPKRYKEGGKRKGVNFSMQFSQKNGFAGNKLILPPQPGYSRGSEMIFSNYQSYRNDPQVVEGWWAHVVWCDEEVPQKMFERLLTRLYDVRGRMFLTFTTIQGWSPLVNDLLGKTKTLEKRKAPLLKDREIPVLQESLNRADTRIRYLWTQDNHFIPGDTTSRLIGRPENEILSVAYGIPSKPSCSPFPRFDRDVHVIKDDEMPWKRENEYEDPIKYTRYLVLDPAGSKPWFCVWFAVSSNGIIYVYREWPDISWGVWAEPGDDAQIGKPGPAQKPNGWGIDEYHEMIKNEEGEEDIFERLIDPRMGAALTPKVGGSTSIITEMDDLGMTFIPAPGLTKEHGEQLINDALAYDTSKPIGALNHPKLYISDKCENLIECLMNYPANARQDCSFKDPVDCVRYGLEAGLDYIDANGNKSGRTFSY